MNKAYNCAIWICLNPGHQNTHQNGVFEDFDNVDEKENNEFHVDIIGNYLSDINPAIRPSSPLRCEKY